MMLGVVVANVSDARLPVDEELTLACAIGRFFLMVSLEKPSALESLTWIGVAGCG